MNCIKERHSVRQYASKQIGNEIREKIINLINECNRESGLNIQVLFDEPECFKGIMAHYGKFSGVENYIALVGKKASKLDEVAGYYGEKIVLKVQELGLNTCWVALTHGKTYAKVNKDEKLYCLISLGYGINQGYSHKTKTIEKVCNYQKDMPDWFIAGVNAALLAPTAMNQQKFYFELIGDKVKAKVKGIGLYTKMDLGIVKYHFELVSRHKID